MLITLARPSVRRIAAALDTPKTTIHNDIKAIRKEWKEERLRDVGEAIEEELARLAQIEQAAWSAIAEAQQSAETNATVTKTVGKKVEEVTETKTLKGQIPSAEHMNVLVRCSESRRKLRGLDNPEMIDLMSGGKRIAVTINLGENEPIDPADYPQAAEPEDEDTRATAEDLGEVEGE